MNGPFSKMTEHGRAECLDLLQLAYGQMQKGAYGTALSFMDRVVGKAEASGYRSPRASATARSAAACLLARGSLVDDPTPELDAARKRIVGLGDPSTIKGLVDGMGAKGPSYRQRRETELLAEGHDPAYVVDLLAIEYQDLVQALMRDDPDLRWDRPRAEAIAKDIMERPRDG